MTQTLTQFLAESPREIQEVVFLPTGTHPVWPDQAEVLGLAMMQLLQRVPTIANEVPLAYVGVHARNNLTRSRYSLGWLITDQRVLVQDDFSIVGEAAAPRAFPHYRDISAEQLTSQLWAAFNLSQVVEMGDSIVKALGQSLRGVLDIIVPAVGQGRELPVARSAATTLAERIPELRLTGVFVWPSANPKLFDKLSKSLSSNDLRCVVADKPLFGGPYGLAITPTGVLSKDLMEKPVSANWASVKAYPAEPEAAQEDGIHAGGVRLVIPPHEKKHREAICRLLNEIASGQVTVA